MVSSRSAISRNVGLMVAVLAILAGGSVQLQAQSEVKGVEATYNVTKAGGQQIVIDGTYTFLEGEAGFLVSAPMSGTPTNTYVEYIAFAGAEYFSEITDWMTGEKVATLRDENRMFLRRQELLRAALLGEIKDEYAPGTQLNHRRGMTKIVSDMTRSEEGSFVREIKAEYFYSATSDRSSPVAVEIRWSEEDRSDRVISVPGGGDDPSTYTYSEIREPREEMLAIYETGGIPYGMTVHDSRDMNNQYRYAWAGEPQPFTGLKDETKFWLMMVALGGFVLIGSAWLIRNFFVRLDHVSES